MASKAEQYRQRAREAEEVADKAADPDLKDSYREVARKWRELADQAERNGW